MISSLRRLGGRPWIVAPLALLVAILIPALAYAVVATAAPGVLPVLQYVVATAYLLTALMTLLEARAATGIRDEPAPVALDDAVGLAELPTLTAIVCAYLPNEQELVAETIVHLATELRVAPGSLQIILAYNTPQDMPDIESVLASLAALDVAFTPLRVATSHSKGENITAALPLIRGEVTVLLDADHRPQRDAATRALRWFESGYDMVQGRCVIREHQTNMLARLVAVEFEQIYAVSHAGRSLMFDTAMFCGTNGWWRSSVLRELGMNHNMLTEDIDSSVRGLLAGYRMIHDRSIISTELAPPNVKAWWGQRLRWAQGWFQVTLRHQAAVIRSPRLTGELKLYWTYLLGWRELFPLLSLQIFSLLIASALLGNRFTWFYDPYLDATSIVTVVAGPLLGIYTYRLALDDRRRELRRWFVIYALTSLFYTTAKNTVAIVATVRELLGQRGWIITQRSTKAKETPRVAVTAALALLALAVFAGAASAAETSTVPLAPLASSMTLVGRAPLSEIEVPVPHDWKTFAGRLQLRWQASPEVTPNSTLQISVDGLLADTASIGPGPGGAEIPLPSQPVAGGQIAIEIAGQLHTRIDTQCCIPDAGTAAVVALSPTSSKLTVSGIRQTTQPLLAGIPDSLVDSVGNRATPLQIVLAPQPSADAIRAAVIIAGAVARATASMTVPIRVSYSVGSAALAALPGQVVQILDRGKPRVSVRRRADGRLIVSMSGQGDGVVRVAWALAQVHPVFLPGSRAAISGGLPAAVAATPPAATARIATVGASGTGAFDLPAVFRLPESRQLTGGRAHLELDGGYTAPAGGRVDIELNGYPLTSQNLATQGLGQLHFAIDLVESPVDAIDHRVALGLLYAGNNILSIKADLPAGQPAGGAGDALAPDFHLLPSSSISFTSRPRSAPPSLALWPWPFTQTSAMASTTLVLPAGPTPDELDWTIKTFDEASRWIAAPVAPRISVGPTSLPAGNVVVLVRGTTPAVPLPAGAPTGGQPGVLETYESAGRHLLVAYGLRALRPLSYDYQVGEVNGAAAIVQPDGTARTLVSAPSVTAFTGQSLPWKVPVGIIVIAAVGLLVVRIRKVRARLVELPASSSPPPMPDDPFVRAQLSDWERLAAVDANGSPARDDRPPRS
jgi:cellulose synthase/poly-beta-1,6-N-acetylglucosamine synthase-like glycosyltransferase